VRVADPERIGRFRREAKTLAALNHPNIAIIHGLEESGGVHALVMELVEGPTLDGRREPALRLLAGTLVPCRNSVAPPKWRDARCSWLSRLSSSGDSCRAHPASNRLFGRSVILDYW
jgi:serine/threonine protein kinase